MAEKITEALWKAFIKKLKIELDDGALQKALAKFDKTDAAKPEPRLHALNELADQAKKLIASLTKKKKELGDKVFIEVKNKLQELVEEVERLSKELRVAIAMAEVADETDSPELLTTKMTPLVRELRKGDSTMHALIGTAGRNTAVLIMRRPITTSRRKLIAEALDAVGGAKFIVAECRFEDSALTFIVKSEASGLAKRLGGALLAQLKVRLKIRVRGEDPADLDEDGEDEPEPASQAASETPLSPPTTAASEALVSTLAHDYGKRLELITPILTSALRRENSDAGKLRSVIAFAIQKASSGNFTAAIKGLETLEKMLAAGPVTSSSTKPELINSNGVTDKLDKRLEVRVSELANALELAAKAGHPLAARLQAKLAETLARYETSAVLSEEKATEAILKAVNSIGQALSLPTDVSPNTRKTAQKYGAEQAWQTARRSWQDAIEAVDAQINAVRAKMLASSNPDLLQIAEKGLPALTDNHKTPVMRALFDVEASAGDARQSAAAEGRIAVQNFAQHLRSSALVNVLDSNSNAAFGVKLTIASLIVPALDGLDDALGQLLND